MALEIRGIHCDPARRLITIKTMKQIIKKASLCNINALHLHLTDDQGIAFESTTLDFKGGWTIKEQEKITKYCQKYNITIIPEIDIPGHTTALCSILDDGIYKPNKQMGIISDSLIKLKDMKKILELYTEVAERFKCKYFHMGGDETRNATPIFFQKIVDQVCEWGIKNNISIIAWEDVLNKIEPPENLIIQKWKVFSHNKFFDLDKKRTIISLGFYLDRMIDPYTMYKTKIDSDVLGYVACSWNELIDDNNIISTIFPSLYLIGEKWNGNNNAKSIPLLYELCEKNGWIENNNQNTWKRRQWKSFVLDNKKIPIRSSSSTTTETILDRVHDDYPLISNFLIVFAYDIYKLINENIIPSDTKIKEYTDALVEAKCEINIINSLWKKGTHIANLYEIIKKIKRNLETEEQDTYKNGFICIFRELLR